MSSRTLSPYAAFTLIELLVVIGIICLLAAILFPVFARVRGNGLRAACQSNLKQMNLAVMQYTQDYDDHFPFGISNDDDGNILTSLDLVQPYLKNRQVAICPADGDEPDIRVGKYFPVIGENGRSSYTSNDKLCSYGGISPPSLAEVIQPSRLPLSWDAYDARFEFPEIFVEVQRRHFDGANCAFVDGHVKFIKTKPELSDPLPEFSDKYWNAPASAE